MSYNPNNANGSATSANSTPVVIASDQVGVKALVNDGTNTAGVFVPGTPNSSANALVAAGTSESHAFSITALSFGTTYDVGNLAWVSVQVTGYYSGGSVTFQTSNDGTNWVNATLINGAGTTGVNSATSMAFVGVSHGPLQARYFRLSFTGTYSSGTTAGTIVFSSTPRALQAQSVVANQNGTWGVGLAAQTTGGYSSGIISTATTTTVKSGAGTLHTISILGGTAGAIDVYDNTAGSGTKLVPTFTPGSVTTPATLTFDVAFATGLTIVTGAATLLQVSYK